MENPEQQDQTPISPVDQGPDLPAFEINRPVRSAPIPEHYNRNIYIGAGLVALVLVILCVIGGVLVVNMTPPDLSAMFSPALSTATPQGQLIPPGALKNLLFYESFKNQPDGLHTDWEVLNTTYQSEFYASSLSILGLQDMVVGDVNWSNYRLSFSGYGTMEIDRKLEAYVYFTDLDNHLKLVCLPLERSATGSIPCHWEAVVLGTSRALSYTYFRLACDDPCLISIEANQGNIRTSVNQVQMVEFQQSIFFKGKAGIRVSSASNYYDLDYFKVERLEPDAKGNSILFFDTFTEWFTGEDEDDLSTSLASLTENGYLWKMTAKDDKAAYYLPVLEEMDLPDQFKFSLTIQGINESMDAGYSLMFRLNEYEDTYTFEISENGYYCFGKVIEGKQTDLMDWTATEYILPDYPNRLEVEGDGNLYFVFINGHRVAGISDDSLKGGSIAFGWSLANGGDKGDFLFSDLQVWVP